MRVQSKPVGFLTPAHETALPGTGNALLCVSASVVLMALAAQMRFPVPGTEVPATLQSFVLLLVAFVLTPGQAFAAMAAYLALGLCGAPVFAAGSPGILGSTGGFLVGFAVCAPLMALLRGTHAALPRLVTSGLVGFALLFAMGNLWRWGYWSRVEGQGVSLVATLATGLLPFAPKALVEILLAASLVRVVRRSRNAGSHTVGD